MERLAGQTILVTGGTGFIGSHLVIELLKTGTRVVVPYIEIDEGSIFQTHGLSKKVISENIDITDKKRIFAFIKKHRIDYIIHLAAQTLVTQAYRNPLGTLHTNIAGTYNLLEAVRVAKNIKGIIIASSDKAYGKTNKPYKETYPLHGDYPYDVSKTCADLIGQSYYATYNVPVVITRFGNVYGEGDLHFDRIVPGICEAIVTKKTLQIRSNGKYVRDYIYVKDVVDGYVFLLKHFPSTKGEAYNFSSFDTLSVVELVEKAGKILHVKIPYKILNTVKSEIPYQHLDDGKVRKLGWENMYTFESTFQQVLSWYKNILFS